MGGYGYAINSASFQRKYENLPAHSYIILTYDAYIIDPVGDELPVQSVGTAASPTDYPVYPFSLVSILTTLPNDFCGSGAIKDAGPITVLQVVPHSDSILYFNWAMNIANLGIRNIKIEIVVADLSSVVSCSIMDPSSLLSFGGCPCPQGQYMNTVCTNCDDACGDCYGGDASSCFSTNDGYYFDGTTSYQCDSSCGTCSGPGSNECITCPWGDPADANNECIFVCDAACATCSGPYFNMCSVCNDGYYFDGTSSCLDCDPTCETCSGAGSSACLTCPWGDPADANSQCILVCDATCNTCYDTDAGSCYTCNDGYYFDGVSSCLACDNSCETCSSGGPNGCLTCPWGDLADADSACILVCDSACKTCYDTDPNSCYTCNDGHYFDGTSSCLSCDSTCNTCSGAGSCDSCKNGYYFDGTSSCLDCDSSCKTCSGPGPNACLICPWGDPADANSECTEAPVKTSTKRITDTKKKMQTAVGAGLILNTMFNPGSSAAIRISMLAQMIQYIKYLDINYPYDVQYAISNWDDDFINFSNEDADMTPNSLEDYGSAYGSLPSPFTMYDDEIDPSFLINFWQQLLTLFIVSGLLIFMAILKVIVSRKTFGETSKKLIHQLRICSQGLLITFLYDDFADIFFFAILSYRTTKKATALTVINIIVSVLFIIITVGALIAHNWIVKKYQNAKIKDQEKFEKFDSKLEGAKILWKDCKEDSFLKMNALFFAVLHNILFCFILAMLYEHPLAQVILINILSFVMLCYLLWFRPFDEKREFIQTIVLETILFAVNICLLILMILDSNSNSRDSVGEAILVLTLIFNFIPMIFLAITLISITIKIYHAMKAYQLKRTLERLKKSGVHIKKSQVAPEPVKGDVSIHLKDNVNFELTQTNSLVLAPQNSHPTNLFTPESKEQSNFHFSPSKPTLNFVGLSDNEDQFLKPEDCADSMRNSAKFSRTSLFANNQQKIFRKRAQLKVQINNSVNLDCESQSLAE